MTSHENRTMKTTRRNFLMGAGLFGGALMLGGKAALAANGALPAASTTPLKGKLYGLGMAGSKFPGNQSKPLGTTSVMISFDLETRKVTHTSLDMGDGHAAMGAGDGRILCVAHHKPVSMMLDKDHNVLATFTAPAGFLYGGHALVMKERNQFLLPMRAETPHTAKDTGRLEVYDLTTFKKIDMVDSGGIQPHELHVVPNKPNEIAITHYGDIAEAKPPLEFNVLDSKLTIMDSQTLKPLRHYEQNGFNAMATHMRVSNDGWAYIVLTQYIGFKPPELLQPGETAVKVALADLKRLFNQTWEGPIPDVAMEEMHIAVGLPFLRVNTQTGERQLIYKGDKYHQRSQSVAYNTMLDTAVGLYYFSDNLVLHSPGKDAEVITNLQLKLDGIRGVAEIPGTPYIAVCGTRRNVSVFDLQTRQTIALFNSKNFNTTHLYHEADV